MNTVAQYRHLVGRVGVPYVALLVLTRLPMAMIVFGTLTFVGVARDSVADAGMVCGVLAVCTAIAQPLQGRWTQSAGQRLPLVLLAVVSAAALTAIVLAGRAGAPLAVLLVCAAVAGLSNLPIGGLSRVRWTRVTQDPRRLHAAMSLESVTDEITFVMGPALVGVLAAVTDPAVALLLAAGGTLVLVPLFALHPLSPGPAGRDVVGSSAGMIPTLRHVAVPVGGLVCVGAFFGATQTAVSALGTHLGEPGAGGLVYAALGLGSSVSALGAVALPERFALRTRVLVCALGMAAVSLAAVPLERGTSASTLVLAALLMTMLGVFVGVTLVSVYSIISDLAPPSGVAVAMTAGGAGTVAGVALGTSPAGALAEAIGPGAGFGVSVLAGLVLAVLATRVPRERVVHDTRPEAAPPGRPGAERG